MGYVSGFDDIVPFHGLTPNVFHADESMLLFTLEMLLSLVSSTRDPFFLTIICYNEANLHLKLTSLPIYVKSPDNLIASWVYDGDDPGVDLDYQQSTTYISSHAMFGVNCPMEVIEWGLESVDGMIVLNFSTTKLQNRTFFIMR